MRVKRNATLPKLSQSTDALVGLHACTNFVQANMSDFQAALKRFGSINKLKASVKTAIVSQSFALSHKQGQLPEFYAKDKARLLADKENARAQAEYERIQEENK